MRGGQLYIAVIKTTYMHVCYEKDYVIITY